LPSCYAGRVDIVDVWGWPPLMVNEVSHDLDGGEVETPSLPCTISNVGSKWSPQFCFYGINSEPLTLLLWPFTSLDESGPSLSLILKLALLYCLQWMGVMTLDVAQWESWSRSLPSTISLHEVGHLLLLRIITGQVSLHLALMLVMPTFVC
jgi:hypothetical protein